jgi:hypothetical protein
MTIKREAEPLEHFLAVFCGQSPVVTHGAHCAHGPGDGQSKCGIGLRQ